MTRTDARGPTCRAAATSSERDSESEHVPRDPSPGGGRAGGGGGDARGERPSGREMRPRAGAPQSAGDRIGANRAHRLFREASLWRSACRGRPVIRPAGRPAGRRGGGLVEGKGPEGEAGAVVGRVRLCRARRRRRLRALHTRGGRPGGGARISGTIRQRSRGRARPAGARDRPSSPPPHTHSKPPPPSSGVTGRAARLRTCGGKGLG